jgi:hypothetical protein
MSTAAALTPVAGDIVADPTTAEPIDYTNWPASYLTGYLLVANTSTTDAVYLVTDALDTESGRSIPAGGTATFGPYLRNTDLWIVGADASPVSYSFDLVFSEGY